MAGKINIQVKKSAQLGKAQVWNDQLTVGLSAAALVLFSCFLIWEDINYRNERKASLLAISGWQGFEQQKTKASFGRSASDEYRQALKVAMGYMTQYQRNPAKGENLLLAAAQLNIALKQIGSEASYENARLKIHSKLQEVEAEIKSKGLALDDIEDAAIQSGNVIMKSDLGQETP